MPQVNDIQNTIDENQDAGNRQNRINDAHRDAQRSCALGHCQLHDGYTAEKHDAAYHCHDKQFNDDFQYFSRCSLNLVCEEAHAHVVALAEYISSRKQCHPGKTVCQQLFGNGTRAVEKVACYDLIRANAYHEGENNTTRIAQDGVNALSN